MATECIIEGWGENQGLESRFEVWRACFMLEGLIEGLEGRFEV